ncbi:hypothetical protein [Streptomyces sp. NPDC026659]|uniref:hypothetical protein n=1 Tax=Streptomyces sp. NPDC026659 TaxID=3155123 RepID=UPI0034012817
MPQKPQAYRLTDPTVEPSAVPGCSECLSLSLNRQNARSRGDYSAVSDANVMLRRHQAEAHTS